MFILFLNVFFKIDRLITEGTNLVEVVEYNVQSKSSSEMLFEHTSTREGFTFDSHEPLFCHQTTQNSTQLSPVSAPLPNRKQTVLLPLESTQSVAAWIMIVASFCHRETIPLTELAKLGSNLSALTNKMQTFENPCPPSLAQLVRSMDLFRQEQEIVKEASLSVLSISS